jgi:integrase
MFGKCRRVEQMNLQLSFSAAPNAIIRSGNTHKRSDFKGNILKLALSLRNLGYSDAYLTHMVRALNSIAAKIDLHGTNSFYDFLNRLKVRESYKANLCDFYSHYCKFYEISFVKPKYRRDHKLPRVPTKEKINLILGHASKKYVIIYKIAMECGLRPVEIGNLTLNDIDLDKGLLSVYSAKKGNPRVLKLQSDTLALLITYVKGKNFGLNEQIFPRGGIISNTYERLKASVAKRLNDPELKKIRLYDLRHYYATMLYYKTKDILLVKEKLGHRNINNTLVYTHLVNFSENEEYYSATAKNLQEACKLIEEGFEYVTEMDSVKLFRKRK